MVSMHSNATLTYFFSIPVSTKTTVSAYADAHKKPYVDQPVLLVSARVDSRHSFDSCAIVAVDFAAGQPTNVHFVNERVCQRRASAR